MTTQASWRALGRTRGFERCGQDFYLDLQHPKELWVYPLRRSALQRLRAPELSADLREGGRSLPPPSPVKTSEEAAVAAHLPQMDLAGLVLIGDTAHTVKANLPDRQLRNMRHPAVLIALLTRSGG